MATPDLRAALDGYFAALNAIFRGETAPMAAVWSHADDITYMSPFGDLLEGWAATEASWASQAAAITGGSIHGESVHLYTADTLGVAVAWERGEVTMGGATVPISIRATTTFRLEGGAWRMIGHHTDRV